MFIARLIVCVKFNDEMCNFHVLWNAFHASTVWICIRLRSINVRLTVDYSRVFKENVAACQCLRESGVMQGLLCYFQNKLVLIGFSLCSLIVLTYAPVNFEHFSIFTPTFCVSHGLRSSLLKCIFFGCCFVNRSKVWYDPYSYVDILCNCRQCFVPWPLLGT